MTKANDRLSANYFCNQTWCWSPFAFNGSRPFACQTLYVLRGSTIGGSRVGREARINPSLLARAASPSAGRVPFWSIVKAVREILHVVVGQTPVLSSATGFYAREHATLGYPGGKFYKTHAHETNVRRVFFVNSNIGPVIFYAEAISMTRTYILCLSPCLKGKYELVVMPQCSSKSFLHQGR